MVVLLVFANYRASETFSSIVVMIFSWDLLRSVVNCAIVTFICATVALLDDVAVARLDIASMVRSWW